MSSPRITVSDRHENSQIDLTTTTNTQVTNSTKSSVKRAFDVAFLMRPDEKPKQKHFRPNNEDAIVTFSQITLRQPPSSSPTSSSNHSSPTNLAQRHHNHQHQISVKSDEVLRRSIDSNDDQLETTTPSPRYFAEQTSMNNNNAVDMINHNTLEAFRMSRYAIYSQQHAAARLQRIYDDPSIDVTSLGNEHHHQKSAFTKVPSQHPSIIRSESPIPSSSPDQLSCPSSSPPSVSVSPPRLASNNIIYQNFRPAEYREFVNAAAVGHQFHTIHQLQQAAAASQNHHRFKQQFMYRAPANSLEDHHGHRHFSNGHPQQNLETNSSAQHHHPNNHFPGIGTTTPNAHHHHQHHHHHTGADLSGLARNPAAAAALLTSLIPPTIATTFTLTAQNVCAKCNISFRMTSDLVYHMRSHHKSEFPGGDTNRRKREEKLKCPVCNESFRERHHLTRHMTAHQDKESDEAPVGAAAAAAAAAAEGGLQLLGNGSGHGHMLHRSRHGK